MLEAQRASQRLAEATAARLTALWGLVEADDLPLSEFRALAAASVAQANAAGVQLADIAVAAEVTRQLRTPTSPLGLAPTAVQTAPERITADIDRIITRNDSPIDELAQWGRSEPLLTVATAVQTAMQQRDAKGWTRQLSGISCELCKGWADGVVRPPGTRMARHPGCDCIQSPQF